MTGEQDTLQGASVLTHLEGSAAAEISDAKSAIEAEAAAWAHVRQSQALMRADRFKEALAEARCGQAADPRNADCRMLQSEALLALEDFEGAEQGLRQACEAFPEHAQLWALLSTASWNIGRHDAALTAIDRALALVPKAHFATQKGWMLFKRGELARAEIILRDAIARSPACPSAHRILTHVYKVWERWAEGAATSERACAEDPADFDMRESWAYCLLVAGRPREAITVIEDGLQMFGAAPDAFQLLMRKAEAHRQLGDVNGAIDAVASAVALRPDDEAALGQLSYMLATEGRFTLARRYQTRLLELQARQLPERLVEGLEMIWERARVADVDPAALKWAWELADQSAWDRAEWETAAAWGKEANLLLRHWWQAAPEKIDQMDALLDKPDLSEFFATSLHGGSCILVGAHVGPTAAALNLFQTTNRPFRTFGSADRDRANGATVIPVMSNSVATMRAHVNWVKSGAIIGLMGDASLARETLSVEFLRRRVELPVWVPRLIQACKSSSLWCCPLWRDGRIVLELERLPDPLEGEPRNAWTQRWFSAYLDKLERVMRGRPENLVLFAGIWGNVNSTVLERRKQLAKGRRLSVVGC